MTPQLKGVSHGIPRAIVRCMIIIKFNTLTGPVRLEMTREQAANSVYAKAVEGLLADPAAVSLVTLGVPDHGRVEIERVAE